MRPGMIFDFDGTIADSMGVWHWVDMEFLIRRGITPPDDYSKVLSTMGYDRAAAYVKKEFDITDSPSAIMDEWNALALERYKTSVFFKPFAREYIELLRQNKDTKIAIATTLSRHLLDAALENNNAAHLFDAIVSGYEVTTDKTNSEIYLLAAKRIGVEPSRCAVFEDILPGIQSAKRAGMFTIGVLDAAGHQDTEAVRQEADMFIESFNSLLTLS